MNRRQHLEDHIENLVEGLCYDFIIREPGKKYSDEFRRRFSRIKLLKKLSIGIIVTDLDGEEEYIPAHSILSFLAVKKGQ